MNMKPIIFHLEGANFYRILYNYPSKNPLIVPARSFNIEESTTYERNHPENVEGRVNNLTKHITAKGLCYSLHYFQYISMGRWHLENAI